MKIKQSQRCRVYSYIGDKGSLKASLANAIESCTKKLRKQSIRNGFVYILILEIEASYKVP
jgi:hypothetical protein